MIPRRIKDNMGERIYTQSWIWDENKNEYEVELFLIIKIGESWNTKSYKTKYRALKKEELTHFLTDSGFVNVKWSMPDSSEYYQPIIAAIKPQEEM